MYYIVMEKADVSLFEKKQRDPQGFDDMHLIQYLFETVQACLHLKKYKMYHRDIKPGNILLKDG